MARSSKHSIVLLDGSTRRKFCKLLFTGDGSYSVTAPYHSAKKAFLCKATVNYGTKQQSVSINDTIDLSELDDGRLKLSHHLSGFVQYSGDGVVSGLDDKKQPKGLGVFSAPLQEVGSGPAVTVGVQGIEQLDDATKSSNKDIELDLSTLAPKPGSNGIMVQFHYFQPFARRFVRRDSDGKLWMSVMHPSSIITPMRVVLAPDGCDYPGLIAIDMYEQKFSSGESGFSLCGPGENTRFNACGERIADVLMCHYPRPVNSELAQSLDYKPDSER
jgi:hypothetical protein